MNERLTRTKDLRGPWNEDRGAGMLEIKRREEKGNS
jgi:hypothetical protein